MLSKHHVWHRLKMVKSYFLQMINCEGKGSITSVTLYLEVTPKNGTTLSSHHVRHLHLLGVTKLLCQCLIWWAWAILCWGIVHLSKIYWHNHVVMTFVTRKVCYQLSQSPHLLSKILKESSQPIMLTLLTFFNIQWLSNNDFIFHLSSGMFTVSDSLGKAAS